MAPHLSHHSRAFIPRGISLNEAVQKALADPELRQQLQERGAEAAPGTPQALAAFVRSELTRWGDAVRRSGARVD